jgi:hypothetical protein
VSIDVKRGGGVGPVGSANAPATIDEAAIDEAGRSSSARWARAVRVARPLSAVSVSLVP